MRVISLHDQQAGKVPWEADSRDRVMRDGKRILALVLHVCRSEQWRRQLWGTGARASPRLPRLRANYPSIA